MTVNNVDGGRGNGTATTDASGRFIVGGLPPGRYAIQASKRAWLDANFGATRPGRPGTPVVVREGERVENLKIAMWRAAVITGSVRDQGGEPLPGIAISVLRSAIKDGARTLTRQTSIDEVVTDDEGIYRIYGLPPGDYAVMASPRRNGAASLAGIDARQIAAGEVDRALRPGSDSLPVAGPMLGNTSIFFPGTSDPDAAAVLSLAPGDERTGIDLPFELVPTARLSGTVTWPAGPTPQLVEVRLFLGNREGYPAEALVAASAALFVARDKRFVFPGVGAGRYTLFAAAGNLPSDNSGPPRLLGWARTEILIDGRDMDIVLDLKPPLTIAGHVAFEGAPVPATSVPSNANGLQIVLRTPGESTSAPVASDGTFKFPIPLPGRFAISATLPREGPWFLKSVQLRGQDVLDVPLAIQAGETIDDLVLTFTDRPSELTGSVQRSGDPVPDCFVVVFPADRSAWLPLSRRIRSARPGTDGVFSLKGLPAGDYFVAVRTDVDPDELSLPTFLDELVPSALKVTIVNGERTVQALKLAGR